MMRSIGLLAAVLAVGAVGALTLAPAQAEHKWGHCDTAIHHPTDPDAFGSGRPNSYACEWWDRWIKVCDRDVDNRQVRAWIWGEFSSSPRPTGWAPSRGCHAEGTSYASGNIIKYRVCVEAQGCSGWRKP